MATSRNVRIEMNQNFHHPPTLARRFTKPRSTVLGLVVIATLLLGSFASGAQGATPKTITLGATQNGSVVTVSPGTHIDVTLASNKWTFSTVGSRAVVKLLSWTTTKGATPGATRACVPGRSCASSIARYFALEPGLMRLTAKLTSCPTGAVCTASDSHWTVVIRVR
jgi:hypothetical protein